MLRINDSIKEFKNGNINIKYDPNIIKEAGKDELWTLSSVLDNIDCYFIGETYCLGNYETGHTVYNAHSDLVYIFAWSDLEKLKAGHTVKLYARKPEKEDRETMESEGY